MASRPSGKMLTSLPPDPARHQDSAITQPARQPHHLNVAPSFTLQSPARLDPVEIAVDVELQQHRWMIRRPARYLGIDPAKPQIRQIEFLDKDIDHANRIVLADPVCHAFRKQRALPAIRPLNEALHLILPQIARESYPENQIQRCVFTQPGTRADIDRPLLGLFSRAFNLVVDIRRASPKASAGVENGIVAASLSPSSSYIVTMKPAWRGRSRRW